MSENHLIQAYLDYLVTARIRERIDFYYPSYDKALHVRALTCYERFLMFLANCRTNDSIFSASVSDYRMADQKLTGELYNDTTSDQLDPDRTGRMVKDINRAIELRREGKEIPDFYPVSKNNVNVSYRKYKDYYSPERLKMLFTIYPDTKLLTSICMKYSSLLSGGQHFSIPQSFADALYQYFNVRNEGFASPFNSRYIDKPDAKYCSLFPEVEYHYRSQGSFFGTELEGNWEVNPPFIESILELTADRILQRLESGKQAQTFVVIFPDWTDAVGFQKLQSAERFLKRLVILERHKHHYLTLPDSKYLSQFNTHIFFLSSDPDFPEHQIDNVVASWLEN